MRDLKIRDRAVLAAVKTVEESAGKVGRAELALHQLPAADQDPDTPVVEPRTAYPLLPAADVRSDAIATHFP